MSCPGSLLLVVVMATPSQLAPPPPLGFQQQQFKFDGVFKPGATPTPATPAAVATPDEDVVRAAGLTLDDTALVEFFQTRSRSAVNADEVRDLARRIEDPDARVRDRAAAALVALGPPAVPLLRQVANDPTSPGADLARTCLRSVTGPGAAALPTAAARLLAARKPAAAAEALLAYLPFADDESVTEQVNQSLAAVAFPDGKPAPALLRGLEADSPVCRAAAGIALCRPGQTGIVVKLLRDPQPVVRLRVGVALARAQEASAVPVLIDLLTDLPAEQCRQVEEVLQELAGDWALDFKHFKDDPISRRIRRDAWAVWWRVADGPALLGEFHARTLDDAGRKKVQSLVADLGAEDFAVRERAMRELPTLGPRAVPFLRDAGKDADLERSRRAQECLERIAKGERDPLPVAAARLVALRQPAGAAEVLLDFLPWADGDAMAREVQEALIVLAARGSEVDPVFVRSLRDADPVRRKAAAEALLKRGGRDHWAELRKLLVDADPEVRLSAARGLAASGDRDAVPTLIDALTAWPPDHAGRAVEVLAVIAGEKSPDVPLGTEAEQRKKCREAWAAWWREHGEKADLGRLKDEAGEYLGYTLVVELRPGRLREVGRDGKTRWQIDNIGGAIDAHLLPGGRVLVAEYDVNKVTERDLKGKVLWEKQLPNNPVNVQRLANGNTFIVTLVEAMEVDRSGKAVWSKRIEGGPAAGYRMPNGETVLINRAECFWFDAKGEQVKRFPVPGIGEVSGIGVAPGGRVVIASQGSQMVAVYDRDGKKYWEASVPGVLSATWLANGHVLAACYSGRKVVELNSAGKPVWETNCEIGPFRARRR